MKAKITPVYRVQVLDRAVSVLNALGTRESLALYEVATAVGVHKSTAHRILMNLEAHRLVNRDPATGRYRLGLRLFELGSLAVTQINVRERARTYLERVVNEAGETVHLCVLDAGEALYLDKVEPTRSVRLSSRIGLRNPVHCTAVGKAMMALLSDSEVDGIVSRHGLKRFTSRTLVTAAELKSDLGKVRRRGYALDDEEHEDGVRCVAAAVRDHAGRPTAAISVSGPSFRMTLERVPVFARIICKAADGLSRELGYEPAATKAAAAG